MQPPTRMPLVPSVYQDIWGIFDDDLRPVFDVDSYLEVGFKAKTKVSHFPVERGGFANYNKVQEPQDIKIRIAVGGDGARIAKLLSDLEIEKNDVSLYRVVTPQQTYVNMNLVSYDYKRTQEKGRNLIIADLDLIEIRQVDSAYATVKIPPTKAKDSNTPDKKATGQAQAESETDSHWAIAKKTSLSNIAGAALEISSRSK